MGKIALLIGINYFNTHAELRGCINDTISIKNYLINKLNYKNENIIHITDKSKIIPTKKNIIDNLSNVVNKINNSDFNEFFLFYSGHGSNILDTNNDEKDGMDEILIPVDYNSNIIRDDELHSIISKINKKCKIFGLFDCCNSGTILDLKYLLRTKKLTTNENNNNKINKNLDICFISGCRDDQTSADFFNVNTNRYSGALTTSFFDALSRLKNNISFHNLMNKMTRYLVLNNFTQRPQLSSNKKINDLTYYYKSNTLLVQDKVNQQNQQNRRRFRNRREYIMYLRYLRYLRYRRWLASRRR